MADSEQSSSEEKFVSEEYLSWKEMTTNSQKYLESFGISWKMITFAYRKKTDVNQLMKRIVIILCRVEGNPQDRTRAKDLW